MYIYAYVVFIWQSLTGALERRKSSIICISANRNTFARPSGRYFNSARCDCTFLDSHRALCADNSGYRVPGITRNRLENTLSKAYFQFRRVSSTTSIALVLQRRRNSLPRLAELVSKNALGECAPLLFWCSSINLSGSRFILRNLILGDTNGGSRVSGRKVKAMHCCRRSNVWFVHYILYICRWIQVGASLAPASKPIKSHLEKFSNIVFGGIE